MSFSHHLLKQLRGHFIGRGVGGLVNAIAHQFLQVLCVVHMGRHRHAICMSRVNDGGKLLRGHTILIGIDARFSRCAKYKSL